MHTAGFPSYNNNNTAYFTQLRQTDRKPILKSELFSELSIQDALIKEYIYSNEDNEYTFRTKKAFNKLESLRIFPLQIFVLGFCIWIEKINFECLDNYPNKRMDEIMSGLFQKIIKIPDMATYGRRTFIGSNISFTHNFYDYYIKPLFNYNKTTRYLDFFYSSMNSKDNQLVSSLFMKIFCLYRILYDKSISEQLLNYVGYQVKINNIIDEIICCDSKISPFSENNVLLVLALNIEIRIKLIKIFPLKKKIDCESYPPKKNDGNRNQNKNLKLKFLLINQTELYRAYKKVKNDSSYTFIEKIEHRPFYSDIKRSNYPKCKVCEEITTEFNQRNLCNQCLKKPYCSIDRKIITSKVPFFTNNCGHLYCLICLQDLLKNFEKNQIICSEANCRSYIYLDRLKEFIHNLEEFNIQCASCKQKIKIKKDDVYFTCFDCKVDNCVKHKNLLEKCFCLCPDCKKPVKITTYDFNSFHQDVVECQYCSTFWCKTCKFRMSMENYYYCKCKCSTCFEFTAEFDKNIKTKCKSCVFVCQACNIDYGEKGAFAIGTCPKCSMSMCRSCKNNCFSTLARNEIEGFEKIDLASYCRFCFIKQKGL